MENLRKKLKTVQKTADTPNQSTTGADTVIIPSMNPNFEVEKLVDELDLPSSSNDGPETNAVEHRHHHESLDFEWLKNSSSSNWQMNNLNKDGLNEDCLLELFSYLSVDDMIQVKRVCKKWYQASQHYFKQVQTLLYYEDDDGNGKLELYEKYYERKVYKTTGPDGFDDLISILHSCGHHIKYFNAEIFLEEVDPTNANIIPKEKNPNKERQDFIFQWVPKLCDNIVVVQIHGESNINTRWNFEVMATFWKKLEYIDIEDLHQSDEENFLELLRKNNQLKTLKLWFDSEYQGPINGKFFSYLPTTIEEIIITGKIIYDAEQSCHFISACKNFTSLQSLRLSGVTYLSDDVVAAIANIKTLKHLSLCPVHNFESRTTIDLIANLKDLKSLCLSDSSELFEDNVINIVENCIELEALYVSNVNGLTNRGLATIAKLKKLKCLDIDMSNVTVDSIIFFFDSIEVLGCSNSGMDNIDAIKLLKKATNLRFVHFESCNNLTEDILHAANEIVNERKNNVLCMRFLSFLNPEDIDTPYFKFFGDDRIMPGDMFPEDIVNHVKLFYEQ